MVPTNRVTVPAVDEPITVQEVKDSAYAIDSSMDDRTIRNIFIPYARAIVEKLSRRSMMTQTRIQLYDHIPNYIDVMHGPLQSVVSFTYVDDDGVTRTIASTDYRVDGYRMPPRVTPAVDASWPYVTPITNSTVLTYVAGYGDNRDDVPMEYRGAMILLATQFYNNRGICALGTEIMGAVENLIDIAGKTETYA